jgi:pyridoxamine 5'-phosphate oxidase family protein
MSFTQAELDYLASQRLGRLGTLAPDGTLQVSPTSFFLNADGSVDIGGAALGQSKKFRNVAATGQAAFVIDDIASVDPWVVRGVEVRGTAEALTGQEPPMRGFSNEIIRIHPRRIISWGLGESAGYRPNSRTVVS